MQQVSCRALGVLLKMVKRKGDLNALLIDVPYDLAYLHDTRHRIEWSAFTQILRNARTTYSLTQLSDLNEAFMRSPFFAYVGVIARMLFTSRDLFDWVCKRQVGAGAQLFHDCIKPSFEHLSHDVTVIRLEITGAYEPSPEFFWMTRGAFVAMPRMVRAGDAEVDMTTDGRVATYHVRYKNKRGTLAALVRWLSSPFTVRAAARELKRTNEELQARLYEVAEANRAVERQATLLRTAHSVSALIYGDLDLERTLESIRRTLIDQAGFERIEIVGEALPALVDAAAATPVLLLRRPLTANAGQRLGELRAVPRADADLDEREALLSFIVPTIELALQNALSYRDLENYRQNLQLLVDERTSELTTARDALAVTVEQLRDAQSGREIFFANVNHEFRAPLSLIGLAVGELETRAGAGLDAGATRALATVSSSARRLLRLVDEILQLAMGGDGVTKITPVPTNLGAAITGLAELWRPAAEAAGLTFNTVVPARLWAVVDPVSLEWMVTNILSNAIKYTPVGGMIELDLSVAADASTVAIAVRDTGIGLEPALLDRLFTRGARGDRVGARHGSGIGLAVVHQLAAAHGGSIVAEPRASGGTEFRLVLPVGDLANAPATDAGVALRLQPSDFGVETTPLVSGQVFVPPGTSKGTILVAEDGPRLAAQLAAVLGDEYTVIVALDGVEALAQVELHQPQLLVTDIDMPRMNGLELASRFRHASGDRLAPVIILSGFGDLATRVQGLDAGAVDYMTKPVDPRELKARVHAQFRMRDLALRLQRAEQLASLGSLAAGLAHELRNPANGVINALLPLREMLPTELAFGTAPTARLLEIASSCAEQIAAVSRHLLDFRGERELVLRDVTFDDLVARSQLLAQDALRGVEVRRSGSSSLHIRCAMSLLVQVLTNLIENAGQAAGPGGWIEVLATTVDDHVCIEVGDSGPGVPLGLRERVFDPFFTTKEPGVGTGLGLPLARDIVHRHGGVLHICERAGRSVFVLDLPQPLVS